MVITMDPLLDPREFGDHRSVKFVRFTPSGTILFCDACDMCVSHSSLVYFQRERVPNDNPVGAGQILVRDGRWCFSGFYGYSTSIANQFNVKVGSLDDDEQVVQGAFDALSVPLRYDCELPYS